MLVRIEAFPGVNKKETETLLKPGEFSDMSNVLITDDKKPKKMYGYAKLFATLGAHSINGMWFGSLSGTDHFLFSCNGHIYEQNLSTHANTDLGALTDALTSFFVTNNTVYIMNGANIYSWAGSGSIAAVVGYVPTVVTAAPPEGGGTLLEPINYLSGTKIQKFSPDGIAYVFQLAEYDIDSVDLVTVGGVDQVLTTDYTVDLSAGTVTFVALLTEGTNSVSIKFTKVTTGDRELITKNLYFGGVYYSRFWLYGNPDHKNTRYVSGVTMAGVSDPTYWPKYTDSDVGEYEITGICTQYDKQIIFTSGDSEASSWYSYVDTYTDSSTGLVVTLFPVKPINSQYGNEARGQIRIIYNNPFTVWKGIYQWKSTAVVNEKDVLWMSENIQRDLATLDLSTALTMDWPHKGLYWVCVGKKVWVLNYRIGAWYILDIAHTPTCFLVADGEMYFGTDAGLIMKFDENLGTFDGADIDSYCDTGYMTFDAEFVEKEIWDMWISIVAYTQTHLDVYVSTDKNANWVQVEPTKPIEYSLSSFETWDFSDFSFETSFAPQPFKRSPRLNGVGYVKFRFQSNGTDTFALLSHIVDVVSNNVTNRR